MSDMRRTFTSSAEESTVVLPLTRPQQMALLSFLADYMRMPNAIEMSVDVLTDTETTPGELLQLVMEAKA
jgi:hypothetical protein